MNLEETPYYKDYKQIVQGLNSYRYLNPMTNEQGNKLRHLAGSAVIANKYGMLTANILGCLKEYDDYFNKHKGAKDSLGDLKNNLFGSIIGQVMPPQSNGTRLFDLIYKGFVK